MHSVLRIVATMHIRVEICLINKRWVVQEVRMHDEIAKKKPLGSAMGQSLQFVLKVTHTSKTTSSLYKFVTSDFVRVIDSFDIEAV